MEVIDFIFHLDEYIHQIINIFGGWTYVILFLIIFAETGFVVTPFLPGDSLLFIVGSLAGAGFLNIWLVYFSLLLAAILGDTVNYWLGSKFGTRFFVSDKSKIFNKTHLEKTRKFYEKYGGKTIIIARFVPIIRTFAPFVAGVGEMHYNTFLFYNVIGAVIWVTSLTFAGYFFGGLPFIQHNFEYAVFGIIAISLLPMAFEYILHKREQRKLGVAIVEDSKIRKTFRKENLEA